MSQPGEHERRVDAAIAEFLAAADQGQAPPRTAWLAANPELADDLAAFLDDRAHLDKVAPKIDSDDTLSSPTAPDPQAPLGIVRYFGDYELLEEIARGGMGVVYRARQMSLNRIVALKMILAGRFASPADVQRFRTEAEAAANLDHPNILPIYEVGEHEGQQYFSMKLIEGGTLPSMLHGNPPVATGGLVRMLVAVARAVHYAHQRGILHRDLKPANILLDGQGTPFVTDFGLAKRVEGDSGLTQSGAIVGTPSYMAPEQAAAQKTLSTAVDVYSLGAILYECLTGRPPFKAATPLDTVLEVLEKEPARPTDCDRDLATIALKCLEKQPAKRYDSASSFAEELDRWQRGEPIVARPVGKSERAWRWAKRNPLVAGLSAGLLASLLTGVLVLSALLANNSYLLKRSNKFATDAGRERALAHDRLMRRYAADAQRMIDQGDYFGALPWLVEAYAGQAAIFNADTTVERTRLALLERHSPRLLRRFPGEHASAVLSPDGRRVLTAGGRWDKSEVRIWDAETGEVLIGPIAHSAKTYTVIHASFNADGSRFLTTYGHQVRVWDSHNGKLLSPGDEAKKIAGTYAQFAPDGRRLITRLVEEKGRDFYVGHARLWDGLTGEPLTPPLSHGDATHVVDAALSPDRAMIVTAGSDGTVRLWHTETGQPAAKPLKFDGELKSCQFRPDGKIVMIQANEKLFFQSLPENTRAEYGDASEQTIRQAWFRPDGKFLIARDDDGDVFICDGTTGKYVDGSNVKPDRSGSGDVVLCPDGLELAVRSIRDEFPKRVRLSQAEFAPPRLPGDCGRPAEYSRDGSRLLTLNGRDDACLWDLVAPAQLAPRIAWDHPLARAIPLPGGKKVLLASRRRFVQIWDDAKRATIGPPHEYLSNRITGPFAVRPDGGAVAFVRDRDVHLLDTNTGELIGKAMTHVADVVAMRFSPDGGRLAIAGGESCHLYDCSRSGQRVELAESRNTDSVAFSPDGRWLILGSSWGPLYNRSGGGTLRWYNLSAGGRLTATREHAEGAESGLDGISISADSKWLLSMGGLTARLWNVSTATPNWSPLALRQPGVSCAFGSTDSGLVAIGCADGSARIWSISNSKPVTPPLPVGALPTQVSFTADDRFLITRTDEHTRLWDARTGEAVGPAFEGVADGLADDGRLLVVHAGLGRWVDLSPSERSPEEWRQRSLVHARRQIDATGGYIPVEGGRLDEVFVDWNEPANDATARQIAWHRIRSEDSSAFRQPDDWEDYTGQERVYRVYEITVALDHLARWAELAPADPLPHFYRARVLSRLTDWKAAEPAYSHAIDLGMHNSKTFAERGWARVEGKRYAEAAADFAAAGPGLLSNRVAHALSLFAAQDVEAFRKARGAQLSRALSGGENERLATATLVSLDPVGDEVAVAALCKWFQLEATKSPNRRFESNFRLAQIGLMVRTGEFQAVIDDVTKSWPGHLNSDPRGWFWRAVAHHKLSQKAEAQKALEEGKRILSERPADNWQEQLVNELIRGIAEAELRR